MGHCRVLSQGCPIKSIAQNVKGSPTKDQKASTVADSLLQKVFSRFDPPQKVVTRIRGKRLAVGHKASVRPFTALLYFLRSSSDMA